MIASHAGLQPAGDLRVALGGGDEVRVADAGGGGGVERLLGRVEHVRDVDVAIRRSRAAAVILDAGGKQVLFEQDVVAELVGQPVPGRALSDV